ncbi:uncharacterized protein LOC113040876 [Carassius auratus]|uniref:Uncharacterized protein LOC113040876 n=1 Tax=Carassius auratus TaxID=7957 RepID=A0A6P6J3U0_CARAU|nr:uncharacterized protein LOC113040876 [Carassius auratus]
MSSELREVLVEVYVNGVFYCTDSFWASDDKDVDSEITSAIYDHFSCYKRENIHVQLEEVSCEEKDVQLEADINDAISESVLLVFEELTDPLGPSTKVEGSISETDQEGMDVSPETSEENIPTEFAKVRKTMSEFFRTGISSQSKTDPAVSESLCEEAGRSSEIGQGDMDASSEVSEEDIPIDFAKVRRTISEFFRTGNSAKPKTDLAVSEVLCKGVGSSSEIGQGGMVASFDICHEDIAIEYAKVRKTISAFFQKRFEISEQPDPDVSESLCVPDASVLGPKSEPLSSTSELMEPGLDPEEWSILNSSGPEPASPECLVVDISDATSEPRSQMMVSEDLTDPEGPSAEVLGSSSGNDQGDTAVSPETPEEDIPTEYVKVRKINKMSMFFKKLFGISAQPQKDPAVPEPPCIPEASAPEQEPLVTELSVLENYIPQNISQLKKRLEEHTPSETPVTEVWPNIFLGNEETARDRTKLKEMGITHILNAAAVKKKLRVLMGMPKAKDLNGKINTGKKYYRGMNIKYRGLPTTHRDGLNMGRYFLPAAKFIHKALRNPDNKVFIHCSDGVSHSPTLLLAYLVIHHDMMVEEAIDQVIKVRHIKPSMSFLTQLMSLNAELVEQRKQPGSKVLLKTYIRSKTPDTMSSELREVLVEVYVNGVFYCTDSFWASDDKDVDSEITSAIYDHFSCYKRENIHVQLEEVSCEEKDVQLEAYINDAISESVLLVFEELTDPLGPSTKVEGSISETDQEGMDVSPETSEENIPTEFAKVRKTMSEFFRTGISSQSKTDPAVSESLCEEAGRSSEIGQGDMDASSEVSEEDIPIDFAKVRRTISEFFRTGNSAKPKTDLAVSEVLCKGVGSSSEIGQGGMVASFDICHEDIAIEYAKVRKTISAFFQKRFEISEQPDPDVSESLCVPDASVLGPKSEPLSSTSELMEPGLDPEEWSILNSSGPEPASPECLVVDISDATSEPRSQMMVSEDLTDPEGPSAEVLGSSSGNDQGDTAVSPETPEEDIPTEYVKVRKINKMSMFFKKLFGISAQPQKDPAVPEPPCIPEASAPEQEPLVTELSVLENYIPQNISQLKKRLEEHTPSETPVTEVWPNIFLGNEETARDRTKLKEMGITHILNAAAVKKKLRVLMGMPKAKDLNGKINTGKKYYRGMNIKYRGLPTTHRDGLNMGRYFLPAAKFIHKALRNPDNKVFIHCSDGVSHSPTLLLAYLVIHHDMMVEEAIDQVIKVRHIKPSMSFLTQLMSLNAELVEQRKQPGSKVLLKT